jgi:hypothetical protein
MSSYKTIELRHVDICHALMLLGRLAPNCGVRDIIEKVGDPLKERVARGKIEKVARGRYRMRVLRQKR